MAKSKKEFKETTITGLQTLIPNKQVEEQQEKKFSERMKVYDDLNAEALKLIRDSKKNAAHEISPNIVKEWKESGGAGKVGRPRRADKDNTKVSAAERGTKPGETRKTYVVKIEHATALEQIAYWHRKKVKECMAEALQAYIEKNPINK